MCVCVRERERERDIKWKTENRIEDFYSKLCLYCGSEVFCNDIKNIINFLENFFPF